MLERPLPGMDSDHADHLIHALVACVGVEKGWVVLKCYIDLVMEGQINMEEIGASQPRSYGITDLETWDGSISRLRREVDYMPSIDEDIGDKKTTTTPDSHTKQEKRDESRVQKDERA